MQLLYEIERVYSKGHDMISYKSRGVGGRHYLCIHLEYFEC